MYIYVHTNIYIHMHMYITDTCTYTFTFTHMWIWRVRSWRFFPNVNSLSPYLDPTVDDINPQHYLKDPKLDVVWYIPYSLGHAGFISSAV